MIQDLFKKMFSAEFKELEALKVEKAAWLGDKTKLEADLTQAKATVVPEALQTQFKSELEAALIKLQDTHKVEVEALKTEYTNKISTLETNHTTALKAEKDSVVAQVNKQMATLGAKASLPIEVEQNAKFPGVTFKTIK